MISKDKTYRTACGDEVRIYATDGGWTGKVHGAVNKGSSGNPNWIAMQWTESGMVMGLMNSGYDLIEVKPRHKRTVWLNVYKGTSDVHTDKPMADFLASKKEEPRIACIRVDLDFEEGEGL